MARMLVLTCCEYLSFVAWIFAKLAKACLPVLGTFTRTFLTMFEVWLPRLAVNHHCETLPNMQRCYENTINHYIHTCYEDDNFEWYPGQLHSVWFEWMLLDSELLLWSKVQVLNGQLGPVLEPAAKAGKWLGIVESCHFQAWFIDVWRRASLEKISFFSVQQSKSWSVAVQNVGSPALDLEVFKQDRVSRDSRDSRGFQYFNAASPPEPHIIHQLHSACFWFVGVHTEQLTWWQLGMQSQLVRFLTCVVKVKKSTSLRR